ASSSSVFLYATAHNLLDLRYMRRSRLAGPGGARRPAPAQIIDLLRDRPRRAGELADAIGPKPPALSRHLRIMKASGLVAQGHLQLTRGVRFYTPIGFARSPPCHPRGCRIGSRSAARATLELSSRHRTALPVPRDGAAPFSRSVPFLSTGKTSSSRRRRS